MLRGLIAALLALMLGALRAPPARAEAAAAPATAPAVEPPPQGAGADAFATYARMLFRIGRYVEAAEALELAYAASPRPLFLFNAGQSYRKGDRPQEALIQYHRFLAVAPQDPLVGEASGYAKDMQALLDAQQRNQTVKLKLETELEAERQAAAERQRALVAERERALKTERERLAKTQAELEKAKHPPFYRRPLFWGIVSPILVGGVAAVVGGVISNKNVREKNATDGGSFTVEF